MIYRLFFGIKMTLLTCIKRDFLQSRKDRNELKISLLSTLIGEAENIGKNNGNRETTDDEVLNLIKKFLKGINDSLGFMTNAKNEEAVNMLSNEKNILEIYLPAQMEDKDIVQVLQAQINDGSIVVGPKFKAEAMKYLKQNFNGKYDGKMASKVIDALN